MSNMNILNTFCYVNSHLYPAYQLMVNDLKQGEIKCNYEYEGREDDSSLLNIVYGPKDTPQGRFDFDFIRLNSITVFDFLNQGNAFKRGDYILRADNTIFCWGNSSYPSDRMIHQQDYIIYADSLNHETLPDHHPHEKMIVAKAQNMSLCVFSKSFDGKWHEVGLDGELPKFHSKGEYYMCRPEYHDYCLAWLNGEQVETYNPFDDDWDDVDISIDSDEWWINAPFMTLDNKYRLTPKPDPKKIEAAAQDIYENGNHGPKSFTWGEIGEITKSHYIEIAKYTNWMNCNETK